jgi:hypothetical protein
MSQFEGTRLERLRLEHEEREYEEAVASTQDVWNLGVATLRTQHPDGKSEMTFTGTDRAWVHDTAMGLFRALQESRCEPSYPATSPQAGGGWVAVMTWRAA